eukprot:3919777-Prymnesium_polylepis.1
MNSNVAPGHVLAHARLTTTVQKLAGGGGGGTNHRVSPCGPKKTTVLRLRLSSAGCADCKV